MQSGKNRLRLGIGTAIFMTSLVSAHAQEAAAGKLQSPAVQWVRFDDWFYRCATVKSADGKDIQQCEVAQIAQVRQGDQDVNVLTLAIARAAPDAGQKASQNDLLLTALVPLNVVLPVGLGLGAGDKEPVTIPYRNCNQAGCWAQQKLDAKMLDALRKGTSGQASLRLMNGQNVNLKFSLKGLTKALAELQKPSKA